MLCCTICNKCAWTQSSSFYVTWSCQCERLCTHWHEGTPSNSWHAADQTHMGCVVEPCWRRKTQAEFLVPWHWRHLKSHCERARQGNLYCSRWCVDGLSHRPLTTDHWLAQHVRNISIKLYNIKHQNANFLNQYFNFYDAFYMFRTRGFIFRKTVVPACW